MDKRLPNGLTARERQFCRNLCKGMTQLAAYRAAGYGKRANDTTAKAKASRMAGRDIVRATVAEMLQASGVKDLDSVGQAFSDLLQDIASARAQENWTAVAALTRQRLQVLGMLTDRMSVTVENSASDSELAARLAGDDPERQRLIASMLGKSSFDA